MRGIIFRDHDDPGGVPVEPVDYPRPFDPADSREAAGAGKKGVDKRSGAMPGCRVHHHPRGFFDHHKMNVLEQHSDGAVFGDEIQRTGRRDGDRDPFVSPEPCRRPCLRIPQGHHTLADQLLDPGPGQGGEGTRKIAIQPLPRFFRGNRETVDNRHGPFRYQALEGTRPQGFTRRSTSARLKKLVLLTTSGSTRLR